jgi:hypothetical protein
VNQRVNTKTKKWKVKGEGKGRRMGKRFQKFTFQKDEDRLRKLCAKKKKERKIEQVNFGKRNYVKNGECRLLP